MEYMYAAMLLHSAGKEISEEAINDIQFIDYFRYDDVTTSEILEYLILEDDSWDRPSDTGSSSPLYCGYWVTINSVPHQFQIGASSPLHVRF